jgi:GDP-D-mannose dehydratase
VPTGLLLEPSVPAGTYNVASGKSVKMAEVVELLVGLARVPVRVERDEARVRPADIPRLSGDPSKLRAATGWEPKTSFQELVEMMVDADLERLGAAEPAA